MLPRTPPTFSQRNLPVMTRFPCCDRDEQYDDMVECGRCTKWYHYSCVGVNQSVAELAWFCKKCLGEDLSTHELLGKPGASRIQPFRAAKTSKSNKEHSGQSEGVNVVKTCSNRSVQSQTAYSSAASSKNSRKGGSIKSTGSKQDLAVKRIEELMEKSRLETLAEENQLKILELKQKQIERKKQEMDELLQLSKVIEEDSEDEEKEDNVGYRKRIGEWISQCEKVHPVMPQFADDEKNPSGEFSTRFSVVPSRDSEGERERRDHFQMRSSSLIEVPSKLQIASRQVFPRSLPTFSGRPEDWPLFISAYEQANLSCGFTNAENLVRLQEALKGKALDVVRNRLLLPDNVPTIIEKLRRRFGNPAILSTMMAQRIHKLEGPDSENLESVIEFGSAIEEFTQHLEVAKLTDHLKNPILMQSLVQKLPSCYAMQWVEYKRRAKTVDLKTFGKFMEDLVDKALEATFEKLDGSSSKKSEKPKAKGFIYSTEESCKVPEKLKYDFGKKPQTLQIQHSSKKEVSCSVCQIPGHFGRNCREFRNKSLEDRWRIVKRRELCPLCLYNHGNSPCRSNIRCDDKDCNEHHHPLLHPAIHEGTSIMEAPCNNHRLPSRTVMFRIIPVTLYHDSEEVDTLALVDEGSSISLIDCEVAKLLRVDGPCEPLKMCWTNGVSRTETNSKKIDLMISGRNQSKRFDLRAGRTVSKLDLPAQHLDSRQLIQEFQHLKDIEILSYELEEQESQLL
ncbi:uncharacterized protein LOC129773728 [Toxorhynchites rutilus septentrionalis]|uniref:uncharacterized protein LOC129773728 n=1 Tax=Toxorhynchites rutilus septentrionalis TaxID=329112 RepID=UPI002478D467|nr:uncharacterized protein LOC129773728 [Toxorhynchites rutilus septentrionalis]